MKMTLTPLAFSSATISSRRLVSVRVRLEVGSSMITISRAQRERLGDLDQLALGEREVGHQRVGLEVGAQPIEQGLGARPDRGGVDQVKRSERTRLAAEEDIGRHIEIVEQVQFLVNEGNAAADGFRDREIVLLLAPKPDRSGAWLA